MSPVWRRDTSISGCSIFWKDIVAGEEQLLEAVKLDPAIQIASGAGRTISDRGFFREG